MVYPGPSVLCRFWRVGGSAAATPATPPRGCRTTGTCYTQKQVIYYIEYSEHQQILRSYVLYFAKHYAYFLLNLLALYLAVWNLHSSSGGSKFVPQICFFRVFLPAIQYGDGDQSDLSAQSDWIDRMRNQYRLITSYSKLCWSRVYTIYIH